MCIPFKHNDGRGTEREKKENGPMGRRVKSVFFHTYRVRVIGATRGMIGIQMKTRCTTRTETEPKSDRFYFISDIGGWGEKDIKTAKCRR